MNELTQQGPLKLAVEVALALILHPIAVLLAWFDLARRSDIGTTTKVVWGVVSLVWGIGPILYILLGDGQLW